MNNFTFNVQLDNVLICEISSMYVIYSHKFAHKYIYIYISINYETKILIGKIISLFHHNFKKNVF